MIGLMDVKVQAHNPEFPLEPVYVFVGSAQSFRVKNVPKKIGKWDITNVYVNVSYPDNTTISKECVANGCVWVGTVDGCDTSGTCTNGFVVTASGIDEDGNNVTNYVLGAGDLYVKNLDGSISPETTAARMYFYETTPTQPKKGDTTFIDDVLNIWDGTQWKPCADVATPSYIEDSEGNKIEADLSVNKVIPHQTWYVTNTNTGESHSLLPTDSFLSAEYFADEPIEGNRGFKIELNQTGENDYSGLLTEDIYFQGEWVENETFEVELLNGATSATLGQYLIEYADAAPTTIEATLATLDDIPTKTSDLVNDSGFVTSSDLELKQDKLSEAQMDAINKDANAYYTSFYVQGESQEYSFIAPSTLTKNDFAALGVYDTTTGTWTKNLTGIRTGTNVTSLEANLFKDVTTLTYFEGSAFKSGGAQALGGCTGLQTLILPKVHLIPINFCSGCTALRNLTIPASITSIGRSAFLNCSNL